MDEFFAAFDDYDYDDEESRMLEYQNYQRKKIEEEEALAAIQSRNAARAAAFRFELDAKNPDTIVGLSADTTRHVFSFLFHRVVLAFKLHAKIDREQIRRVLRSRGTSFVALFADSLKSTIYRSFESIEYYGFCDAVARKCKDQHGYIPSDFLQKVRRTISRKSYKQTAINMVVAMIDVALDAAMSNIHKHIRKHIRKIKNGYTGFIEIVWHAWKRILSLEQEQVYYADSIRSALARDAAVAAIAAARREERSAEFAEMTRQRAAVCGNSECEFVRRFDRLCGFFDFKSVM
jgi:hypothetical protein